MPNFTAGTSFTDGVTNDVTALKLNALVADAVPTSSLALASTTGTISNFTSSTANITLGTIPTLTAGTTTGTAGIFTSGTITTGLIPTLTTGTTTSTNEVVTNGTITNLSATTSTFLGTITGSTNVVNIGSGQIYKDASGNVGIGTTSPQTNLHIGSTSNTNHEALVRLNSGGATGQRAGLQFFYENGATPSARISVNASQGALEFDTAGTERLRIDSDGNVRIGTTSFLGGGAQALSVKQNSDAWCMATQVTTNGNYGIVAVNASNAIVGGMIINASSTSFPTSSDYRLKTNLESIANGIERIKQLPVYSFNWKIDKNGNKVDGFIAHEAKAIVPESVVGEKDAVDADGNPIYQGIDQSKIVPLLTAALKEAIAKIETLEAKVTALEAA